MEIFLIFGFLNILTQYLNLRVSGVSIDMYASLYGNYLLFVISAFSGISAFLIAVQKIRTNAVFQYIGRNSLIYLALHQSIVFSILDMVFKNDLNNKSSFLNTMIIGLIYTIIAISLNAIRILPFLTFHSKGFPI